MKHTGVGLANPKASPMLPSNFTVDFPTGSGAEWIKIKDTLLWSINLATLINCTFFKSWESLKDFCPSHPPCSHRSPWEVSSFSQMATCSQRAAGVVGSPEICVQTMHNTKRPLGESADWKPVEPKHPWHDMGCVSNLLDLLPDFKYNNQFCGPFCYNTISFI